MTVQDGWEGGREGGGGDPRQRDQVWLQYPCWAEGPGFMALCAFARVDISCDREMWGSCSRFSGMTQTSTADQTRHLCPPLPGGPSRAPSLAASCSSPLLPNYLEDARGQTHWKLAFLARCCEIFPFQKDWSPEHPGPRAFCGWRSLATAAAASHVGPQRATFAVQVCYQLNPNYKP